jgi:hypothetical protein
MIPSGKAHNEMLLPDEATDEPSPTLFPPKAARSFEAAFTQDLIL